MPSITSVNAVYMLVIPAVFPVPQQLQGFSADDIFDSEALASAEALMGLDGVLSAGFVFVPIKQGISLQADSPSNVVFDAWWTAQQVAKEVFPASAIINLGSIRRTYALATGWLTTYPALPDAKKTLTPRKYGITWGNIIPAPL